MAVDASAPVPLPGPPIRGGLGDPAASDRADERRRAREARRAVKLGARQRRAEARKAAVEAAALRRDEASAAAAAERVDDDTAAQESPELATAVDGGAATVAETAAEAEPRPAPEPEPEPEPEVDERVERALRVEDDDDLLPADRPAAVATPPTPEPSTADDRPVPAPAPVAVAVTIPDTPDDDGIVEAPREPAQPLSQRLRPRSGDGRGRRRLVVALAGLLGAAGLVCSVVLAFGALLVALDSTDGSVYETVSGVCDTLVGPLRDAVSFSGENSGMKEALVAWGAGAIAYLVVGVVAQSLLRSTVED